MKMLKILALLPLFLLNTAQADYYPSRQFIHNADRFVHSVRRVARQLRRMTGDSHLTRDAYELLRKTRRFRDRLRDGGRRHRLRRSFKRLKREYRHFRRAYRESRGVRQSHRLRRRMRRMRHIFRQLREDADAELFGNRRYRRGW